MSGADRNKSVEMVYGGAAALTVDYADVLRQAVANERHRVMRETRAAIEKLPTEDRNYRNIGIRAYRSTVLDTVDRIDKELGL